MTEDVMKTEGHTPTPWKFHPRHPSRYTRQGIVVDRDAPPESYYVNSTFHDVIDDCKTTALVANVVLLEDRPSEAIANAHLIVTAVNERESLLRCEEALRKISQSPDDTEARSVARAALTLLDEARK